MKEEHHGHHQDRTCGAGQVRRYRRGPGCGRAHAHRLRRKQRDSDSGLDGTYYIKDVNGTSELGQLVVKGNTVSHQEYTCDGVYEEPDVTSTGEFNKDQAQIIWMVAGDDSRNERTGTESISTSDTSISINGNAYVRDNSDAGKALLDAFKAKCAK
ncbi:hypothetical protein ACFVYE_36960 [Streptomyces sp. NPDC058239]|uniref:hypothetical protein n=1 Tax=Streptomyces sp. NPDC058239 TaxID=3346395 RepID=UPI0036EC21A9